MTRPGRRSTDRTIMRGPGCSIGVFIFEVPVMHLHYQHIDSRHILDRKIRG